MAMEFPATPLPLSTSDPRDARNSCESDVSLTIKPSDQGLERAERLKGSARHLPPDHKIIQPQDLKEAKNRLKEVPVYYVSRLDDVIHPHGYIGVGHPGDKQHASTILVTGGYRRQSVDLNSEMLNRILGRKYSFLGIQFGGYRFSKEIRDTVARMNHELKPDEKHFACREDFYRAYRKTRLQGATKCSPRLEKQIYLEHQALCRAFPATGNAEIWPDGVASENRVPRFDYIASTDREEEDYITKYGFGYDDVERFNMLLGKEISQLSDHEKCELNVYKSWMREQAVEYFQNKLPKQDWEGFRNNHKVSARKVEGLKNIDVLEAHRQVLLTRLFVDEKLRRVGSMIPLDVHCQNIPKHATENPAEEVPAPVEDKTAPADDTDPADRWVKIEKGRWVEKTTVDGKKQPDDHREEKVEEDTNSGWCKDFLPDPGKSDDEYASVREKNRYASVKEKDNQPAKPNEKQSSELKPPKPEKPLSRRALSKRNPKYCRLLKTKQFREPGVGFFTSLFAKLFRGNDSANLANRSNCFSGSASLLRLAARLKGETVRVESASYFGHGVSVDISHFWMPNELVAPPVPIHSRDSDQRSAQA